MSPSWTRWFRPSPAHRTGIAIARDQLCAAVTVPGDTRSRLRALHVQSLPVALFDGVATQAAEDALAQALLLVSAEFRHLYGPVHVALPDTVLRSAVLELEELPKTVQLRHDLLRWRFARQWQRSEDSLDCRGTALGRDGSSHLLFGQAGDRAWLDTVRRALQRAGIRPWSLNAAAIHRFNAFHDLLAGSAGALLALDPDSWSLLLWDEHGRIRDVLTRLRDPVNVAWEPSDIADEVERAIVAYVQKDGRRVDRLHLAGPQRDVTALARVFDVRLREPARPLAPDLSNRAGAAVDEGLAPLALVAALNP